MVSVKFIKPWSAYSPGDIAGFDEDRVKALIKTGAAELYEHANAEGTQSVSEDQVSASNQPAGDAEAAEAKTGRKAKTQ